MHYGLCLLKLLELLKEMLCCGRKKDRLEQEQVVCRYLQNTCLSSTHHHPPPHLSLFDRSKHPLNAEKKRQQQKQRCLYSRSYPESEAVAFGGRPLLQDRSMERTTRTAGGHRWPEKYSREQAGQLRPQSSSRPAVLPHPCKPLLDMGIKSIETFVDYTTVETVEINKRPGQTLGFYIREGNGFDRADGVFISRIAVGSAVERNGLLRVGEEILAIDGLSLKGVCLDDVVILMSIPSRLLLTVKTRKSCCKNLSCPSLPLSPTSPRVPVEQTQVFTKKKLQQQRAIDQPCMQAPYLFHSPYQLPHMPSLHKSFAPPFPSFQQQQQQQYYDPYLRPLKTLKPTYKELYYGHKQPTQTWYPPIDPTFAQKSYDFHHDIKNNASYRSKKQVESLDRKIQGMNGRKNRSMDYFSDGETQMACEYLYGVAANPFERQEEGDDDDFAGIKELSRSLSRHKKASKMRLEQWKYEQKQLSLEKQIERQEQQLYLLQQQLKFELQQQKQHPYNENLSSIPTYYKPSLAYKSSYPSYFDQFEKDQVAARHFLQTTHQPYYPPLQFESDAQFPSDVSKTRRKQKAKNGSKQQEAAQKLYFQDDHSFNLTTPSRRKRYSSDSDIQNGNNYEAVSSSPSTTALEILPGLLSTNEKSSSLPAEIENGALSSNGDDPSQLKHWLRKLDRLSYDLKEFNGRLKNGNGSKGHANGREKGSNNNNKSNGGNDFKKYKALTPTRDVHDSLDTTHAMTSALFGDPNEDSKALKREKKFFDYSSEEYKTWLYDRRLQNKLKRERSEKHQQQLPTSLLQQQRQQQRLKPISSRDRAKLALSESRQKMAQSQFGPKSELRQKQGVHPIDPLKKRLTATASQTTPSIEPDSKGKRKSKSLDNDYDEGTYDLSSGILHASKSRTLETTEVRFNDAQHTQHPHPFDLPAHQGYLDHYTEKQYQYGHQHHRHRHQNSLPETDQIFRRVETEQIFRRADRRDNISENGINDMSIDDLIACPELVDPDSKEFQEMYAQNIQNSRKKKKNGDKLKSEPMKIKVGEFHPHQNNDNIHDGDYAKVDKNGRNKSEKHKNHNITEISSKEALLSQVNSAQTGQLFSGSIYVKIFCGHGLKTTRRTVLRDLYCVLSVDGDSKARTAAKTGAINFDWDEDFEIDLAHSHTINFCIYSWDPVARQRLCYTAQLVIEDFISIHGHQRRLAMKLQPSGTLYVELKYRNLAEKFARVPVPADNAIFGVVLDDLITREASINSSNGVNGSRVPRLVKACVHEVEERGLDSMGIYRISGSHERLNKLKKMMEEHYNDSGNGGLVTWNGTAFEELLCAQNFPDINIVAGLLKSFFLELPDPLMCGDLYDMFVDAIKLQIQNDLSASVGLMLSVLDCLPKNNLALFSFMMDHLKRVERNRAANMMSSRSLGLIFGPLLLCPPISDNGHLRHPRHKRYRSSASVSLNEQAHVITYLIDIWPSK